MEKSPSEEFSIYKLETLTYGTKPASYLTTKCIQIISDNVNVSHPMASEAIRSCFYIDDILTGCDNLADAKNLIVELS